MARAHLFVVVKRVCAVVLLAGGAVVAVAGCPRGRSDASESSTTATPPAPPPAPAPTRTAPVGAPPPEDAAIADAGPPDDPMALHHETREELLELAGIAPDAGSVRFLFGPAAGKFNQGNKALAHHAIGKKQCLEGLAKAGVVVQTPEQRAICGADNMVPIWKGSDPSKATACIDVFEFPNKPCELPYVWGSPTEAQVVCHALGKRLCKQEEWVLGCNGDPAGGKPSRYAYPGDKVDLEICNENKPHPFGPDGKSWTCNVTSAQTTWATCNTETEPAGAYPRCRSRFGVFDQHGNVAEIMTRKNADGDIVSQLKGSAFFYVDVWREYGEPRKDAGSRETYSDECSYDARWHIEPMERALHVNYHLGFRCCKDIPKSD